MARQTEGRVHISRQAKQQPGNGDLDAFFHLSLDLFCIAGVDGYFKRLNPAWEKVLGHTEEELLSTPFLDFVHPDDRDATAAEVQRLAAGHCTISFANRYQCKDGSYKWLRWNATPGPDRRLIYAAARDITELRQEQKRVLQAREKAAEEKFAGRYERLVENAAYGIYMGSPDGRFLYVNGALVTMLGYASREELLAKSLRRDIYARASDRDRVYEQVALNHLPLRGAEVEWKRKDGKTLTVRLSGRPEVDENGKLLFTEMIAENVSERRGLELQVQQSQRMEAIGRLTGGIAHDFNNLISIILGYSEMLLEQFGPDDPRHRPAEAIQNAGERAAALIRQLLAFSRRQILEPAVLDLNHCVTETSRLLQRLLGEDIQLNMALTPGLWRVSVDPSQIEQVIMNLAVNARDAMPNGGTLTVGTANVEVDESHAQRHYPFAAGHYVMLSVSDTGIGMDKETQEHIFEPFFTTKEKGKGTGLGLSTVYGIVKQSGGYVWVYSEPERGSTFKIYLPALAMPGQAVTPARRVPQATLGTETILLVEDEAALRELACEFLRFGGYTVLEAQNPAEALRVAQQYGDTIHLLLTDVILPGSSGPELARQLSDVRPGIKVLFVSGYTDDAIAHHGVLTPEKAFLQKPYTKDLLLRKIRETLERK